MLENALTKRIIQVSFTASACPSVPHPHFDWPMDPMPNNHLDFAPHGLPARQGAHQRSPSPFHQKSGLRINRATIGLTAAISKDESSGRMMVQAVLLCELEFCIDDKVGTTEERTRPMTSSIMAALMSTVPMRVCFNADLPEYANTYVSLHDLGYATERSDFEAPENSY